MRIALVAIGLALAASAQVASAQTAAAPHYRLHTAAELSRLCATPSSESDQVTAVAFCHGVLAGSYGYFLSVTPAADRFVCPPNPAPTRTQVANGFVAWLKARPQYNNDGAIDALFRYAAEAFPCKR
jgi:Rap1a immunity proteins